MSTKAKLTKKMKCLTVQTSIGRNVIMFADEANTTPEKQRGQAQGMQPVINGLTINLTDIKEAQGFEPGKNYTISITE